MGLEDIFKAGGAIPAIFKREREKKKGSRTQVFEKELAQKSELQAVNRAEEERQKRLKLLQTPQEPLEAATGRKQLLGQ